MLGAALPIRWRSGAFLGPGRRMRGCRSASPPGSTRCSRLGLTLPPRRAHRAHHSAAHIGHGALDPGCGASRGSRNLRRPPRRRHQCRAIHSEPVDESTAAFPRRSVAGARPGACRWVSTSLGPSGRPARPARKTIGRRHWARSSRGDLRAPTSKRNRADRAPTTPRAGRRYRPIERARRSGMCHRWASGSAPEYARPFGWIDPAAVDGSPRGSLKACSVVAGVCAGLRVPAWVVDDWVA